MIFGKKFVILILIVILLLIYYIKVQENKPLNEVPIIKNTKTLLVAKTVHLNHTTNPVIAAILRQYRQFVLDSTEDDKSQYGLPLNEILVSC